MYKYKIMEEFAVESFVKKPSLLILDSLKKAGLLAIAGDTRKRIVYSVATERIGED